MAECNWWNKNYIKIQAIFFINKPKGMCLEAIKILSMLIFFFFKKS